MKKLVFLLCILLPAFNCGQSTGPVTAELDAYFSAQFAADEPGGAVLVKLGDKTLYEKGFGIADIETGEKITPETVFNTGSISKTFVSNGILILEQQGKLSIDDTIDRYFPGFKKPDIAKQVTIRHLLSHTSGLIDSRDTRGRREFYLTADDAQNFFPITQNDELGFPPGSRFQYSNPAYDGLALIIEQITDANWREFIKDNVFTPAGMQNSTITDGSHPETGVAHGYIKADGIFRENDFGEVTTFNAAGNGGVWSSVRELAKYEQAIRDRLFLDAETAERSRTVYAPENWDSDQPPGIGCSWFIGETDGLKMVSHTGSQGGFRADYVSIPEKELFYAILCNTPMENSSRFREKVLEILQTHGLLE